MFRISVASLILLVLSSTAQGKTKFSVSRGRLVQRYSSLQPCMNNGSGATRWFSSSLNDLGAKRGVTWNVDFELLRPVILIRETVVVINKCEDSNPATCEEFQTWRLHEETCRLWQTKNSVWSPLHDSIKPILNCPFKAGVYAVRNASLDIEPLYRLGFPFDQYYWRFRLIVFDPKLVLCWEAGASVNRIRS